MPETAPVPAAPSLDDYFRAAHDLAELVRATLDGRKPKRAVVVAALERFERVDYEAM